MLARLGFGDEGAKAAIAFVMALLTCLAAGVASLSTDAAGKQNSAQRSSDQLNEQLVALRGAQQSQLNQDLFAYGLSYREAELSIAESNLAASAIEPQRQRIAELMSGVHTDVSSWLQDQGGLFSPRYYDKEGNVFDYDRYLADIEERSNQISLQAQRDLDVALAWDGIGNTYVTVLTLIAVALFFLGLAASLGGRARPVLGVAGIAVGIIAAGWTATLALTSVPSVPDSAINAVVRAGHSIVSAGNTMGSLTATQQERLDAAVSAGEEAIALDPTYVAAHSARANAYASRGLALFMAPEPDFDAAREDLRKAVAAYRTVLDRQADEPLAWWNLGWCLYLLDDPEGALAASDRAMTLRPDNPALQINRFEALVALGRFEEADQAINQGIDVAVGRAGGATDFTLRAADAELSRLLPLRPDAEAEVITAARDRIRSALVARRLERDPFTLTAPAATISAVVRQAALETTTGEFLTSDPLANGVILRSRGTSGFQVEVSPDGTLPAESFVSIRVWRGVDEVADLRIDRAWSEGATFLVVSPYGRAGRPLDAGPYHLEVYVDAVRVVTFDLVVKDE